MREKGLPKSSSSKRKPAPNSRPSLSDVQITSLACSFLILLTVVVYWTSLSGEFVFDDQQIVLQNPALLNIHTLSDVGRVALGWRQLLFFTYGLNYYWSGLKPFGYHVFNLTLHVTSVLLVYFIILQMAGRGNDSRYIALAGASVFGVHTLLSSAVDYIAGRSSVLCGVFYFLSILLFLEALDDKRRPGVRALFGALAGLSGLFAWQAKQEAITLPAILAALLWLKSEKRDWRYIAALALLPLVLAAMAWRELVQLFSTVMGNKVLVSAGFDAVLPAATYFRSYVSAIVEYYLPRFVYPANLSADPYVVPVTAWYSGEFIVSVIVLGVLVWLVIRRGRGDILFRAGLAAVLLSPLTAYALMPMADVVLEHRAYIPGLATGLLSASLFRWIARSFPTVRIPAAVVAVAGLSILTVQRHPVFANDIALWEDAVRKAPQKARAHFNLGASYQNAHRSSEAVREYQASLLIKPDIHAAYSNMAALQLDSGQLDEAEKTLIKLTELAPDYSEGFVNLSVLYIRKHDAEKAVAAADRAIVNNPGSFAAYFNKGEALTQKGDYAGAVKNYEKAAYMRPDLVSFKLSLANAYVRAGDFKSAESTFLNMADGPMAAEAYRGLAGIYEVTNQDSQAEEYFKKAIAVRPNYAEAHHDLGILYLKKKMLDGAIDELRAAAAQQPDSAPAVLNLSLAYQSKGDLDSAKQVLETYIAQFGDRPSGLLQEIRSRLDRLKERS